MKDLRADKSRWTDTSTGSAIFEICRFGEASEGLKPNPKMSFGLVASSIKFAKTYLSFVTLSLQSGLINLEK